jgi:uncharacterized protein (DUF2252 family)
MSRRFASLPEPIASVADRRAKGKSLRDKVHRSEHGTCTLRHDRPDTLELFNGEIAGRRADLLPIRWGRMAASPFACFRGAAGVMAFDLGKHPAAGVDVQLTGDAHLLNLGAYAAPDGHLVFDLNDFDHACRGPFEWDLKRLAVSFVLAGREAGQHGGDCRDAATVMVASYRTSLERFAQMRVLELARYEITPGSAQRGLSPVFDKAARDTPSRLLKKVTEPDGNGRARFRLEPPVLRPLAEAEATAVLAGLATYRDSLGAGRQQVLDEYRPHDLAFRVVGVGSVGVDAYLVLLYGNGAEDPLFLQIKQVDCCAWSPYLTCSVPDHHGQRAAEAQARTQTVSDPFLGWTRIAGKDYLVRQWSDHKASIDPASLTGRSLLDYAELCGEVLAKSHARTGDAAVLAGYCGSGDHLDQAIAKFAVWYADHTERDHARLCKAIKNGELTAIHGL